MIGKVIKDTYKVVDEIGRGSTSTAYLARDVARGRLVVLKVIHPHLAQEGGFLRRFRQEAERLSRLDAAHAVRVLDDGEEEGQVFVVAEYVQGETLAKVLAGEGALPVERALRWARQIAVCLADGYEKGLVHGDLCPANVVVTPEGTVKVADFGIAPALDRGQLAAREAESARYLAPEQAGGARADIRADIYALGAMLLEMLAGPRPAEGEGDPEGGPVPSARAGIPAGVDAVIQRCMARDPAHRFRVPLDLVWALGDLLPDIQGQPDVSPGIEVALTGQTLGPYRILEQIGQGGMSTVYKGYQPALERYVAIKILPTYLAHERDFAARFEQEAKSVARLNHPHILPVYDFGRDRELSYIVMRYVEAGTLKERLGQPLELRRAAALVAQVGSALDYAHRHGVIHRDVKPANILMDEEGVPLLSDFGLARMIESDARLTKTGVGIGTPAYMSPEQGQGLPVDARTDVYSLGVILYEMLTGRVPFEAETPMAVVLKHISAPLPLPRQINPAIPEAVERVLLKALAKEPADRYATVREMVAALRETVVRAVPEPAPAALPIAIEPAPVALPIAVEPPTPAAGPAAEALPTMPTEAAVPPEAHELPEAEEEEAEDEQEEEEEEPLAPVSPLRIALRALAILATLAVLAAAWWGIQHPEVPQALAAAVQENWPWRPSTPETPFFSEPILAAIASRQPDYADDFSDPASGWPDRSSPRQSIRYQEGAYSVQLWAPGEGVDPSVEEWSRLDDFVAQVDVRWASSATRGAAGLAWRVDQDGNPCYGLEIQPASKSWKIWNRAGTMEIGGASDAIRSGQGWNRLTLVAKGEDVALYVNDAPVATTRDDLCRAGGVQLRVRAAEAGVHVLIDNVKVWDLAGTAPPGKTPPPTPVLTVAPTPTFPSLADEARAFAGPILQAIAGREPDYQDEFGDPKSGWPTGSTPAGDEWGYAGGAYVISSSCLSQGGCSVGVDPDGGPSFADFVLEVDTRITAGENGDWFVTFSNSEQEGPSHRVHYGVKFFVGGGFGVWKNVLGAHHELIGGEATAPAFRPGPDVNHLTLIVQRPWIAIYLNGEPLWLLSDKSLSEGYFGLGVENHAPNTWFRVRFDNVRVWDIGPSTGAPLAERDAVVMVEALNVRAGPGVGYDLVSVVHKGDALDLVARAHAGDWLRVKTAQGREGWIATAFVALFIPLDAIPEEIEIPPTPTPKATPDPSSTGQWLPLSQDPV